jgi:hypothetical protein
MKVAGIQTLANFHTSSLIHACNTSVGACNRANYLISFITIMGLILMLYEIVLWVYSAARNQCVNKALLVDSWWVSLKDGMQWKSYFMT